MTLVTLMVLGSLVAAMLWAAGDGRHRMGLVWLGALTLSVLAWVATGVLVWKAWP